MVGVWVSWRALRLANSSVLEASRNGRSISALYGVGWAEFF
jgi:hypothetical protein